MATVAVFLIRLVSRFFRLIGGQACRFAPSCSEYAAEAFGVHSFFKATRLTLGRVSRCHPFCAGGFDPVPPHSLETV